MKFINTKTALHIHDPFLPRSSNFNNSSPKAWIARPQAMHLHHVITRFRDPYPPTETITL